MYVINTLFLYGFHCIIMSGWTKEKEVSGFTLVLMALVGIGAAAHFSSFGVIAVVMYLAFVLATADSVFDYLKSGVNALKNMFTRNSVEA